MMVNVSENYLLTGTAELTKMLKFKHKLETIEIHGFFLHTPDLPPFFESLSTCINLRKIYLSHLNIQDYGMSYMARIFASNICKVQKLTLHN